MADPIPRRARLFSIAFVLVLASTALAGCADDAGDGGATTTPTGTTSTPTGATPTPSPTGATPTPTGATPTPTGGTPTPTPTGGTPAVATPAPSGRSDVYGLTTGSSTGVYFAIGNGIANAVRNATNAGFTFSEVATSQGSVQNVDRLRQDDHQFALMQNDVAYLAYHGQGRYAGAPVKELRAVASLYPEMIQVVVLKNGGINTLADLAGKRVVLGAPGSGAAVNAGQILNATGVQAQAQYLDLSTAADRLKDGGVDAVFWTGGIPTGAIVSLATTHPVRVLPITGEDKAKLQREAPFYANVTLPAGTYGGVDADVETVAVTAVLMARADVPADDVASLLRILFDGDVVQRSHAQGAYIKLDNAFNGLAGVPFHDGAKYYFATKGRTPPS